MGVRKGRLLCGSALAAISINFVGSFVLAQEPGVVPPAPPSQAAPPTPPPAEQPPPGGPPVSPPAGSPSETPPTAEAPANPEEGKALPTIQIQAKRAQPKPATGRPGAAATGTATPARTAGPPVQGPTPSAAPAAPPSTYQTGAPNTGGGTAAPPQLASQMTVSGADLNARPVTYPAAVLEAAPGLAVVAHADAGKANQYYLRGWNLDHGTDLAIFVDDIPINLPTNVHGQGYADLNFLIPETVNGLDLRKGPYFADVGDFSNAGTLKIGLRDSVDKNIESISVGSFGYLRALALGSAKVGEGSLLYAGEFNTYDGPWTYPDQVRKFSGLLRYSQGTATDGFSVTGQAFTNVWNTADQIPLRAVTTGQIPLYGQLNPTDGGDTDRFSLSARMSQTVDNGSWKANAYVVKYDLDLWNDFTWNTVDPINGDQFHQSDNRFYTGFGLSRTVNGTFYGLPAETTFGIQGRYDDIKMQNNQSIDRLFFYNNLDYHVREGNTGIYAEQTVHWYDWLRTTAGWRGDVFGADVNSILQPVNSGQPYMAIGSPKFTATFGPFEKTEIFTGLGMGYHSNDARATVLTETPGTPGSPELPSPFLVRSRGGEVGIRTKAIPDLNSSVSVFYLHQDSELFFNGDDGTTVPGLPSQRTGIEFTNDYRPFTWMHIDANLALSRARFLGYDANQEETYLSLTGCAPAQQYACAQSQIGNSAGTFVFNAPWMVASGGITLGEDTGWFSALRFRYISSRPLTEDGTFVAPPSNIINANVGYRFANGWRIGLDALNLLNSRTDLATYAYGALIKSDAMYAACNAPNSKIPAAVCANGVMDYVFHPNNPLAFRLSLAGPIESINMPAMADELWHAIPAYEPPPADYNWTGFYVGAHGGESRSKNTGSSINTITGAASATTFSATASDGFGGLQMGYNYMTPSRVVIGFETDITSGGVKAVTTTDASGTSAAQTTVFDSETARFRLGYALGDLLPYATVGWAWSSNQYVRTQLTGTVNYATAGMDEAVNKYLFGWTAGAGFSYAFSPQWSAFAEYRHTTYDAAHLALPFSQISATTTSSVDEVNFGVNYKFDWRAGTPRHPAPYGGVLQQAFYKAPPGSHAYNWTGIYLGAEGGYGLASSHGTLTTAEGDALQPYSFTPRGVFAGAFLGANYQFGRYIVGAEADWQGENLHADNQYYEPIQAATNYPQNPFSVTTTMKDYLSVRGRLGYAWDRFLLFGTAGWAWGNPSTAYGGVGDAPLFINGGNTLASGWTAGVGLEYAFTDHVLGRLEYRYTDLRTSGFVNTATDTADAGGHLPINDFRAGIAYKFDGDLIFAGMLGGAGK